MAIPKYISENFDRFLRVPKSRIGLMEVTDKVTKEIQYLIVVHSTDPTEVEGKTESFTPIARLFSYKDNDNPYTIYDPPL